jgi:hypothetical protein
LAATAEHGSMTQSKAGSQEMNYTYGWKCICKSEMEMHISKLTCIPECLLCGELMFMMYSIDPDGAVWMNKALLLDEQEI